MRRGHGGGNHGSGYGDSGHRYDNPPAPPQNYAGLTCPICGVVSAQGARFCQQCGSSLVPAPCTQCGTALSQNAKFCGSCGKAAK
ncbi:double zinc ribbon domain-containing protein [Cupriavidus basilensis]|uniref:double zinc ribbon domain-containing protein n=1 Tax=Cupriavidus basilensis TaxID=68895 RepID=UPI001E580E6E|nr:zinc ribbon domain-containing protein [Cupriavidus basilensis]